MREKLQRVRHFIVHDLWHDIPTPSRIRSFVLQSVRVCVLAVRNFHVDNCFMRATSLAYVTLLSLVPLLAFAFSVLKGFGVGDRVKPWVIAQVAAGQQEVVEEVIGYVERTNVQALGAIGLVFLLWTTVKVLSSVESSFNEIWNVRRSRPLMRKVADYVSVLVISTLLLSLAMSLTAALQSRVLTARMRNTVILGFATDLFLFWVRFAATWVAFAALYMFMPNTRVRLLPAIVGGVTAGTVWQIAFWGYTYFQVGVARQGAIYGTVAAIPIFMIWLYVSWTIVLFGAEISSATQNVGRYWEEQRAAGASFATVEAVGLRAMAALATAFFRDGTPLSIEQISQQAQAPGRLVEDALQILTDAGLCVEVVSNEAAAYQPGRALENIAPADVRTALRTHGQAIELGADGPEAALVTTILDPTARTADEEPQTLTFRDIAARLAGKT